MPHTKSAVKRMKQSEKRRLSNASFKSKLKTHQRKLLRAIADQRKEDLQSLLRSVVALYDKGVKKGICRANTASRRKSHLTKIVNGLLGVGAKPQGGETLPKSPSMPA